MDMTQLAPNLYVGPQISADDLEVLWNQGFTDVACNRPDAEHPDGATSGAMAAMARNAIRRHASSFASPIGAWLDIGS